MLAIKGTNEDMQCRGFQYEIGKTYKTDKEPILYKQGFHACLNPYDVLDYYQNDGKNRYFLVDLGGTITDGDGYCTNVASSEITFVKEITVNDFSVLFDEFVKDKERIAKPLHVEGFALVKKYDKWNYIGQDGKLLSKDWFDDVSYFYRGIAFVKKDGEWNRLYPDGHLGLNKGE